MARKKTFTWKKGDLALLEGLERYPTTHNGGMGVSCLHGENKEKEAPLGPWCWEPWLSNREAYLVITYCCQGREGKGSKTDTRAHAFLEAAT